MSAPNSPRVAPTEPGGTPLLEEPTSASASVLEEFAKQEADRGAAASEVVRLECAHLGCKVNCKECLQECPECRTHFCAHHMCTTVQNSKKTRTAELRRDLCLENQSLIKCYYCHDPGKDTIFALHGMHYQAGYAKYMPEGYRTAAPSLCHFAASVMRDKGHDISIQVGWLVRPVIEGDEVIKDHHEGDKGPSTCDAHLLYGHVLINGWDPTCDATPAAFVQDDRVAKRVIDTGEMPSPVIVGRHSLPMAPVDARGLYGPDSLKELFEFALSEKEVDGLIAKAMWIRCPGKPPIQFRGNQKTQSDRQQDQQLLDKFRSWATEWSCSALH